MTTYPAHLSFQTHGRIISHPSHFDINHGYLTGFVKGNVRGKAVCHLLVEARMSGGMLSPPLLPWILGPRVETACDRMIEVPSAWVPEWPLYTAKPSPISHLSTDPQERSRCFKSLWLGLSLEIKTEISLFLLMKRQSSYTGHQG